MGKDIASVTHHSSSSRGARSWRSVCVRERDGRREHPTRDNVPLRRTSSNRYATDCLNPTPTPNYPTLPPRPRCGRGTATAIILRPYPPCQQASSTIPRVNKSRRLWSRVLGAGVVTARGFSCAVPRLNNLVESRAPAASTVAGHSCSS